MHPLLPSDACGYHPAFLPEERDELFSPGSKTEAPLAFGLLFALDRWKSYPFTGRAYPAVRAHPAGRKITGRISLLLDFGGEFAIMKSSLYPKGGLGLFMSSVIVKENESLDSALRRFKRNCAKAGIQQEIRKKEHYEKPSVRRKKKSEAARKRKFN